MNRNPATCPHNITSKDPDTDEEYCEDCGDVIVELEKLNDDLWGDIL